jgi:type I restriction enzyme S subunit
MPRLMVQDVTRDGKTVFPSIDFLTEEGAKLSRPCPAGTLTLVCSGTVGVPSFLGIDACIHDGFLGLVDISSDYSDDFIYHQLRSLQELFDASATHGGVFTNLTTVGVADFEIDAPLHLSEQHAIAEALTDADWVIAGLERLIAKKRQIKQGAMQDLLTARRRLPGFSGEWVTKRLLEICQFTSGKAHELHVDPLGEFICVNSKFISSDGKVAKTCNRNFSPARIDDILLVMSDLPNGKALAKVFLVPENDKFAVNQRVCILRPRAEWDAGFLSFILNRNPYFMSFDDGVNQTHLLNSVFEKFELSLPATQQEQTAIAAVLSDMNAELQALDARLTKAQAVKEGMMQVLLTGRVRLV